MYDGFLVGILFEGIHSTCVRHPKYTVKVINIKEHTYFVRLFHFRFNLNKLGAFVLFDAVFMLTRIKFA